MDYTSIKVGQLPTDEISGGNFIPHEVAGILKKATFTDLAAFIGASDAVGFKAVSVQNGDTLPATSTQEFILVGPGTYNNVGGGSTITVTEELNALVSNGTYWFVGVEIPIDAPPGNAVWGQIIGTLSNQTDLQNLFNLKADLVDGKVPSSQLPSYVDDVIEVANYAALPATGETGKIYITIDTEYIYRWSGSAYIRIVDEAAAWGTITGTLSNQTDLQAALDAKEDDIAAGTTAQYWRGDKSWQTLNKAAVGLGSVDNTSDLNKPISTATQTALDGKFDDPTGDTTQYIAGDGSLISFPIAGQAGTLVRSVLNNSGATITKGTVVYINGASGNKPTIAKALATGDSTSAQTFGIVQADISNNANGYVVCVGDLIGVNTSGISVGTQLYLSSSTAGEWTTTKQYAPNHLVYIGVVTRSHATLGQIEVKIQNGYELDEIHDVAITSKVNNEVLVYESSTDLWKNKTIPTILGYTPQSQLSGTGFVKISGSTISYDNSTYALDSSVVKVTTDQNIRGIKTFLGDQSATTLKLVLADYYNDGFITSDNGMLRLLNGTTELFNLASTGDLTAKSFVKSGGTSSQFLMADGSVSTGSGGTVTSVAAITLGTTGTDLSSTVANGTTTPVITLNVPTASATNRGALSAADWTTFNSKQNALTNPVTGTGTSGQIAYWNGTSSITGESNLFWDSTNDRLGIGTTSPVRKLTISNGGAEGIEIGVGSTNDIISYNRATSAYKQLVFEAASYNFGVGNVGIGTTNPSEKLTLTNGKLFLTEADPTIGGKIYGYNDTSTDLYGGGLKFQSRYYDGANYVYADRLTIKGNGNVGIGTTSPLSALTVSGNLSLFATNQIRIYNSAKNNWAEMSSPLVTGDSEIDFKLVTKSGIFYVSPIGTVYINTLGTGLVYSNGGNLTSTNPSDSRLKDDIKDLQYGLNEILQLRPVSYNWKDDKINQGKQFGFIAQEVQEVMPELVKEFETEDGERLGLDKEGIYAALVNAIQEQQKQIEELKKLINK